MAKFGAQCPDLRKSIEVLLQRCLLDTDDEVRDRATYYLNVLRSNDTHCIGDYIINGLQVSVPGLERAVEQYVNADSHEEAFDLKVVPISTQPITATEKRKPALSVEATIAKQEEKKATRQDIYAEQLLQISQFSGIGPLFLSSQPMALTDDVTEYGVSVVKHTFARHVVLQFDCKNTLNDQLLENVSVELEPTPDSADWRILTTVPLESLPYNHLGTTYTLIAIPQQGDDG
ncbi:unnamed protein product, partial [Anisakis simplex]